jgi:DNA-binding CsgD family transcriptional regulator
MARIEAICREDIDERTLRLRVLDEIRRFVPFDAFVWLLTDPETTVGSSPVADLGPGRPSTIELPTLIRLKYCSTTNRWTTLSPRTSMALADNVGTAGTRDEWVNLLGEHGVTDVLSSVAADSYGTWAFIDLWRSGGTFSSSEQMLIAEIIDTVTSTLRRSMLRSFEHGASSASAEGGPVLLLLTDELRLVAQTAEADRVMRALLPTDAERAPIPAAAFNVGAQLLANELGVDDHPARARVHLHDGVWVTLRAARIGEASATAAAIAVSIEPTTAPDRASLYTRAAGLTERETELLRHLVTGHDTRAIAQAMFVSEHTVQDHLKSIFAKTGLNTRRMVVARATGV